MTCQQLVELVTDYLDGTLSWRDRRRFEKHIRACQWCGRYVEQMRVTIRVVGRLDAESLSPTVRSELLAAFSDWNGGEQPLPAPPE
jgi:anti-sigma factor RsiW